MIYYSKKSYITFVVVVKNEKKFDVVLFIISLSFYFLINLLLFTNVYYYCNFF